MAFGPCATPEPEIEAEVTGDGRTLSVNGSEFPANATVTLGGVTLGTATANAEGAFTGEFSVTDCDLTSGTASSTGHRDTGSVDVGGG